MKKSLTTILVIGIVVAFLGMASNIQAQILKQGMKSDEIKAIQEILKEDPTIYPEGYTTGYFGRLTKGAVKRLQKRLSLPETGELDERTQKVIFPELEVRVLSPNGGENWDRSQFHLIKWELPAQTENETFSKIKGLWPRVSIDLFKISSSGTSSNSTFVKHIAFAPYWKGSHSWKISRDIPNGSDYVIRITSIRRSILPCLVSPQKESCLQEKLSLAKDWDESDGTFTISGEVSPSPAPDLSKVIEALEKISSEINRVIEMLKGMSVDQ